VVKWLVEPGQLVAKDQPLLEISTDKVDAEIPRRRRAGSRRSWSSREKRSPSRRCWRNSKPTSAASLPAGEAAEKWTRRPRGSPATWRAPREPPIPAPPRVEPSAPAPLAPPTAGRVRITPVVARMAAEHGLDSVEDPRHRHRRARDAEGRGGIPRFRRRPTRRSAESGPRTGGEKPSVAPPRPGDARTEGGASPSRKLRRASPPQPEGTRSSRGRRSGRGSRSTWSGASTPRPTSTSSRRWTCTRWRRFAPRRKRRG